MAYMLLWALLCRAAQGGLASWHGIFWQVALHTTCMLFSVNGATCAAAQGSLITWKAQLHGLHAELGFRDGLTATWHGTAWQVLLDLRTTLASSLQSMLQSNYCLGNPYFCSAECFEVTRDSHVCCCHCNTHAQHTQGT